VVCRSVILIEGGQCVFSFKDMCSVHNICHIIDSRQKLDTNLLL